MNEGLARHIKKMGFDTKQVKNFKDLSEEDIKGVTVSFLKDAPKFANLMASKTWMLCKSAQKQFCISDHPIGLHNDKDYGPYGNLGLAVRGIEIYMPLSSSLAICLLCPREMEEIFRLQKENRQMDTNFKMLSIMGSTPAIRERARQAIISAEQLAKDVSLEKSNEMLGHIEAGTPIECSADHLLFMKYLQTRFSKRFVFSSNDNWHDIERMLKENPSWKSCGLKPKVG